MEVSVLERERRFKAEIEELSKRVKEIPGLKAKIQETEQLKVQLMIGIVIFIALLTLIVHMILFSDIIYVNILMSQLISRVIYLDLILTSSEDLVDNVHMMSQPHDFLSSDHFVIYFCINIFILF